MVFFFFFLHKILFLIYNLSLLSSALLFTVVTLVFISLVTFSISIYSLYLHISEWLAFASHSSLIQVSEWSLLPFTIYLVLHRLEGKLMCLFPVQCKCFILSVKGKNGRSWGFKLSPLCWSLCLFKSFFKGHLLHPVSHWSCFLSRCTVWPKPGTKAWWVKEKPVPLLIFWQSCWSKLW